MGLVYVNQTHCLVPLCEQAGGGLFEGEVMTRLACVGEGSISFGKPFLLHAKFWKFCLRFGSATLQFSFFLKNSTEYEPP